MATYCDRCEQWWAARSASHVELSCPGCTPCAASEFVPAPCDQSADAQTKPLIFSRWQVSWPCTGCGKTINVYSLDCPHHFTYSCVGCSVRYYVSCEDGLVSVTRPDGPRPLRPRPAGFESN